MGMDLQARPLRYFLAVARESSFSRAAISLNISQPALSAQIRELERILGFQLFQRSSRNVSLTREGRLFLQDARRMVAQASRLTRAAEEIRRSDLRIGTAIYTLLIPERVQLLTSFFHDYPDVRTQVYNRFQVEQYSDLRTGDLDLALAIGLTNARTALEDESQSEIVFPPDLERQVIARREVQLLTPESSPLAGQSDVAIEDLAGQKILMLGDFHGSELIDALSIPLVDAGVELVVPPEGNAIAVEQFSRISGLPAISLGWFRYMEDGSLEVRQAVNGLDVSTELTLLRLSGADHRPQSECFWDYARKWALSDPRFP